MTNATSLERAFVAQAEDAGFMGAAVSAEQLDLLRGGDGKLPQNVFQMVRQAEAEQRRGPGRPRDSRNKRSDTLAKLYLQKFPDPVLAMGALANTPLDQLIETILIADSTAEREERLLKLIDTAEGMIAAIMAQIKSGLFGDKGLDAVDKVTGMLDRVFDAAKALKMKPGDLAIKALNLQLAAHRSAAEYVHSKKPTEANVNLGIDGVMVMPGAGGGSSFDEKDKLVRLAADGLATALASGRIEPEQIAGLRMIEGQLVDAEFSDVVESTEAPDE